MFREQADGHSTIRLPLRNGHFLQGLEVISHPHLRARLYL